MRRVKAFHTEKDGELGRAGGGVTELALATHYSSSIEVAAAEESDWVQRARDGDLEAFDEIMMRYETRLLRFLVGLVGEVEVARELCQDTFLAAYQALPRIQGELRLSSWLHTIALNRARSYHRRQRRRTFLPLGDDRFASPGPDMQESVAAYDAVHRTLAKIPKQYATALLLQNASGLSCREIATVVGCSENAVKIRLMRAREAFKRIYEAEERESCAS